MPRLTPPVGPFRAWRLRRRVRRFGGIAAGRSLTDYELGVSSQNGEDGVLQELLRRLGVNRASHFVEFGANRGEEGNCVLLADYFRWWGLFIESSREHAAALQKKYERSRRIKTTRARVTPDTIEKLLAEAGTPREFALLSIDIDGNDYWVWDAVRSFTPRIVVIEYNANLRLDQSVVMPRDDEHEWDGTDYFGASLGAYQALARQKGYALIHTERTGANAFFVRRSDAAAFQAFGPARAHAANYFCRGVRLPRDPRRRAFKDLSSGELVDAERQPPL